MRLILGLLASLSLAHAVPPTDPQADRDRLLLVPWDPWSLQDRRLANRKLADQLEQPTQRHRIFAGQQRFVAAADAQTGTTYPEPNPWHGHVVADLFFAWQALDGIDLNVNLPVYNVTASSGSQQGTGVLPGVAVHLYRRWDPVAVDFIANHLGPTTLGAGLMVEQISLEGVLIQAQFDALWVRGLIGGQLHLAQDDLLVISAGTGPFSVNWLAWNQFDQTHYLTLAGEAPGLGPHARVAAEVAARLPDEGAVRIAGMARADWIPPRRAGLQLHLGYQARYYQRGVGKNGYNLAPITTGPTMIWVEDTWFTNAFQAWWPAPDYDQWWHTAMVEAHWRFGDHWALRSEVEGALKFFDDPRGRARRLPRPGNPTDQPLYPAPERRVLYRAGVEFTPFRDRPHRLRLWSLNKATLIQSSPKFTQPIRFIDRGPTVAFELEVFL